MDSPNTSSDKADTPAEKPADAEVHAAPPEVPHFESKPVPIKLPIVEPKEGRVKTVGITAAVVLVFAMFAGGAYLMYNNYSSKNIVASQTPIESKKPTVKAVTAQTTISSIKEIVQSTIYPTTWDKEANKAKDESGKVIYTYPYYQLENSEFITEPREGYGMAVSGKSDRGKEAIDKDYSAMIDMLEKKGYKKTDLFLIDTPSLEENKASLYVSETSVCKVNVLHDSSKESYASIGCANKTSYAKQIKVIEPFYKQLIAGLSATAKQDVTIQAPVTISGPFTEDGKDGHRRALMGVYDKTLSTQAMQIALYYQEPEGEWLYVAATNGQVPIPCNAYSTPGMKKAFSGYYCYDTATDTDSTVKLELQDKDI